MMGWPNNYAQVITDETGKVIGIDDENGGELLTGLGALTSGVWKPVHSIFRLRLTGTGNVTVDSKDSLGNISTNLYIYALSGAPNQIEFPYLGDSAIEIRVTLTGTATAEVI